MSGPSPEAPKPEIHVRDWWHEGWYVLIGSSISLVIIGVAAWATHQPWVFPSLGPTAYLLFVAPLAAESCPRNVLLSHAIGIGSALVAVSIFGLLGQPPDLTELTLPRVGAVTVALGLTLALMTWARVPHAPAGATTLIVALGLLHGPRDYAVMMLAVLLLVVVAAVINRIHGTPTPLWGPKVTTPA